MAGAITERPHLEDWQIHSIGWKLGRELSLVGVKVYQVPQKDVISVHDTIMASGLAEHVPTELMGMGRNPLHLRPSQIYLVSEHVNPTELFYEDPDDPIDMTGKWDQEVLSLRFQYRGRKTFVDLRAKFSQYSTTTRTLFYTDLGILSSEQQLKPGELQMLLRLFETYAKGQQPIARGHSKEIVGIDGQKVNPTHKFPF